MVGAAWALCSWLCGNHRDRQPLLDSLDGSAAGPVFNMLFAGKTGMVIFAPQMQGRFPVSPGCAGIVNYRDWAGLVRTGINP